MADVNHNHPHTDRGAINRPFERGPIVAADGGERNAVSRTSKGERSESSGNQRGSHESERQMKNVDHTPPHGDGAERVFERGGEGDAEETEE